MVGVPWKISIVTSFFTTSHNIYRYTCTLNPHTHSLSKGRTGKSTGSQRYLSCSPCPLPAAMQVGDWGKPLLCNDTCNLGKVGRSDGSQMEKTMRAEEGKVSHVYMLCPKEGLTDVSRTDVLPDFIGSAVVQCFWNSWEGGVCVWLCVGRGWMSTCVHILPKHRCYHQLGQVLKLFPLVLFQLLNPEINWH